MYADSFELEEVSRLLLRYLWYVKKQKGSYHYLGKHLLNSKVEGRVCGVCPPPSHHPPSQKVGPPDRGERGRGTDTPGFDTTENKDKEYTVVADRF